MSKPRLIFLSLGIACVLLAGVPAIAGDVYDNGPINGNVDAWTINNGYIVSDSFRIANDGTSIDGIQFGAYLFPGDTLTSVEVSITSAEFGGTTYFDHTVNFSASDCFGNNFGFNVCKETGVFNGPVLSSGTYWLNLQNASVPSGDPVYWDENSGPSLASENSVGTIPSESFTILGNSAGTTPEPSSVVLLGSGVLALAGLLRLKLRI